MLQFTAFRPITYWLPSPAIEPVSIALLPVRWQTSRVTSGVRPVTGGTAHQLQCLIYPALGNQGEKGRLLKLYRESLLQRVVEYRIARLVVEIGKNDGVLVGQALALLVRAIVKPARYKQGDKQDGNRNLPNLSNPSRRSFWHAAVPELATALRPLSCPASAVANPCACRLRADSADCGLSPEPC